jgi:hypothetical protein
MTLLIARRTGRAALLLLGLSTAAAAAQPAATVAVRAGDRTTAIAAADLVRRAPAQPVQSTDHGTPVSFRGWRLQDALAVAGIRTDSLRGPALRDVIVAEAADGYVTVFALPELSPDFGDLGVFLVHERDGAPLGTGEGPWRLVVPSDKRGARAIRQLVRLSLVRVAPPAAP